MKTMLIVGLLAMGISVANASTNTSQVLDVRSNPSQTTAGNTRISVRLSGSTSCTQSGWSSYDYPDSGAGAGIGKTWTAVVLAALASGRSVTIAGTGSCDAFGLETIAFMDAL